MTKGQLSEFGYFDKFDDSYGNLDLNSLATVDEKSPAYAKTSNLKRRKKFYSLDT
jgi:hypothetical protein